KKTGDIVREVGNSEAANVVVGKLRDRWVDVPVVRRGTEIGLPFWLQRIQILNADDEGNDARLLGGYNILIGLGQHDFRCVGIDETLDLIETIKVYSIPGILPYGGSAVQ